MNGWRIKVYGIINFNLITVRTFSTFFLITDFAGVVKATANCVSLCEEHPVTSIWKELLIVFNSGIYLFSTVIPQPHHSHFAAKRRNLFVLKQRHFAKTRNSHRSEPEATVISQRSEEI